MESIEELKCRIVDLRVALAKEKVPRGHCPYSYFDIGVSSPNCNEVDCTECKNMYWDKYRKKVEISVAEL